jgi:hypothetical protein
MRTTLLRPFTTLAILVALAVVVAACAGNDEPVASTVVPTTAAPTTTTTLPPTTTTTITSEPATRVLLLGDSGMYDAEPALRAMFEATGATVEIGAGPGFGLTRLGVRQARAPYPDAWPPLVRDFQPDLSVVMLGVWDVDFIRENGFAAYAAVVEDALAVLTANGGRVLWLGTPPGGPVSFLYINPIYESVAATHPGVMFYGDIDGSLRGPTGDVPVSFVDIDGSTVFLRKDDGWHFCEDGAERLASEVNRLTVVHGLSVPAAEGWEDGDWRSSELYRSAACAP